MGVKDQDSILLPADAEKPTRLRRRALRLAHFAWWLTVGAIVVMTLIALPINLEYYHALCHAMPCIAQQLTPHQMQNLLAHGLTLDWYAVFAIGLQLSQAFAFLLVALIIFLRKPNDAFALLVSFALAIFGGATNPFFFDILAQASPLWWFPTRLLQYIGTVMILVFLYVFPSGVFVPRWTRVAIVLIAVVRVPSYFLSSTRGRSPDVPGFILLAALIVSGMIAQIYRYRRVSNATERQQTKWVVFGVTTAFTAGLILIGSVNLFPERQDNIIVFLITFSLLSVALTLIPVSIGIAILRSHLWEIDIIIRKTLTYSVVTALLVFIYFSSIIVLQRVFSILTGTLQNEIVTVLSTLVIAALFVPLRNRIQDAIDRRFYRKKYDAQRVIAKYAETVRDETDLGKLTEDLVQVVNETMQPKSVRVWLKPTVRGKPEGPHG